MFEYSREYTRVRVCVFEYSRAARKGCQVAREWHYSCNAGPSHLQSPVAAPESVLPEARVPHRQAEGIPLPLEEGEGEGEGEGRRRRRHLRNSTLKKGPNIRADRQTIPPLPSLVPRPTPFRLHESRHRAWYLKSRARRPKE